MNAIVAGATFLGAFFVWVAPVFLIAFGIWLILKSPKLTPEKWRNQAIRWLGVFAVVAGFFVIAMDIGWIK